MSEPMNLKPLIALLEQMNRAPNKERQIALLELSLVSAELDPCPLDFMDLLDGIEALAAIDTKSRKWLETDLDINRFFAA